MMSEQQMEQQSPDYSVEITARAARYYRTTRYIMVVLVVGMGLWFLYDGYVTYPQANEEAIALGDRPPYSAWDIRLQRALGIGLPPLGLLLLFWFLYNSRGAYRLMRDTLSVPGHPPFELDRITQIDRRLWDRKGIAYIDYEDPETGSARRLKLDDFIYERRPTDAIFERIEQNVQARLAEGEGEAGADQDTQA